MGGGPDIIGAFNDRVRRHVNDTLRQYRDELRAVSHEMAARGLASSGPHLKRRIEVLRRWTQALTDQCFGEVTHLPGAQSMHRIVHADFLSEQFHDFFHQAETEVLFKSFGDASTNEVKRQTAAILEGLDHDLRDFQAGLWRPRAQPKETSVTNNAVHIYSSTVGSIQQGGGATLIVSAEYDTGALTEALKVFSKTVEQAQLSDDGRRQITLELVTIRPQLMAVPNTSIVREGLHSLRAIVEGTASGMPRALEGIWKLIQAGTRARSTGATGRPYVREICVCGKCMSA